MVLVTMKIPQLFVVKAVDAPILQVQISFLGAEADSHGPDCSSDHGDSPVCLRQDDRCTCCAGRASSSCAVVEVTAVFGVSTASCGMKLAQGADRALCTGTGPGSDPCHPGGELVAGSPGV